ncbi:MAG: hypothetical protein K0S00_1269 [Xanthobacteraceae bacterium]|jgi:hypothetical protein|nr:hypothetical protein [Xanthobacteraceae bacterium]
MSDSNDQVIGLLRDVLRRQDHIADELGELKVAVHVDVQVSAQHRDQSEARFEAIERTLSQEIKPQTEEWKRMKTIGLGFAGLLALGGISFGAMLAYASDTAVNAVRHWLRIGG